MALDKLVSDHDDILSAPPQAERRQNSPHGVTLVPYGRWGGRKLYEFGVCSRYGVRSGSTETEFCEEDPPWIALLPPWEVATVLIVPLNES